MENHPALTNPKHCSHLKSGWGPAWDQINNSCPGPDFMKNLQKACKENNCKYWDTEDVHCGVYRVGKDSIHISCTRNFLMTDIYSFYSK